MQTAILRKMTIENFKGVRRFSADFGPGTTMIRGENGAGKTTIADAFCWVMFNKDSHGTAPGSNDFREKPLDVDGAEIHNLDTMVELVFDLVNADSPIPGRMILKRLQREVWQTKRGTTVTEMKGNTSTYWINDVETAQRDFQMAVSRMSAPDGYGGELDLVRLLSVLGSFNALPWQDQRKQLLTLSRGVTESLWGMEKYNALTLECTKRGVSVAGLRKIKTEERKNLNHAIEQLPIRIDEARRSLTSFTPEFVTSTKAMKDQAQADIDQCEADIAAEKAGIASKPTVQERFQLEGELVALRNSLTTEHTAKRRELDHAVQDARDELRRAEVALKDIQDAIDKNTALQNDASARRADLKRQYTTEYEAVFTYSADKNCPTCGQEIPAEQYDAALSKAKAAFDDRRRDELGRIKKLGDAASGEVARLQHEIDQLNKQLPAAESRVSVCTIAMETAKAALDACPATVEFSDFPRITQIEKRLKELQTTEADTPTTILTSLQAKRDLAKQNLDLATKTLAEYDLSLQAGQRVLDLESEQAAKASALAATDRMLTLIEQYIRDECTLLEDSINEKFASLRWKLFDVQVNGGINDTCVCMIPCESGLVSYGSANTAAQVNADLEIIDTLSENYEVRLPVFVDNSERVNHIRGAQDAQDVKMLSAGFIRPQQMQLILLSVSKDPKLVIDTQRS